MFQLLKRRIYLKKLEMMLLAKSFLNKDTPAQDEVSEVIDPGGTWKIDGEEIEMHDDTLKNLEDVFIDTVPFTPPSLSFDLYFLIHFNGDSR